jgi:hypothetical protein
VAGGEQCAGHPASPHVHAEVPFVLPARGPDGAVWEEVKGVLPEWDGERGSQPVRPPRLAAVQPCRRSAGSSPSSCRQGVALPFPQAARR